MAIDSASKRASVPGVARPWMRSHWPGTKDAAWRHSVGNSYAGVAGEVAPPVVGGTGDGTLSTSAGVAGLMTAEGTALLRPTSGVACLVKASGTADLSTSAGAACLMTASGQAALRTSSGAAGLSAASGQAALATSDGIAGLNTTEGEAELARASIALTGFEGRPREQEEAEA
jgi:hypothetical protein